VPMEGCNALLVALGWGEIGIPDGDGNPTYLLPGIACNLLLMVGHHKIKKRKPIRRQLAS
jgi:hypothetical protein